MDLEPLSAVSESDYFKLHPKSRLDNFPLIANNCKVISMIIQYGKYKIDKGLFLAPMESVSDYPFRMICKEIGGVDVLYSEFISSKLSFGMRTGLLKK